MFFFIFFPPSFTVSYLGNLDQAEVIGKEALKILPHDPTIMFSLANVLGKLQKYKVSNITNDSVICTFMQRNATASMVVFSSVYCSEEQTTAFTSFIFN